MKHTRTTFLALTLTALLGAVPMFVQAQEPPPPDFGGDSDPFANDDPFGAEDPFAGGNPFADPATGSDSGAGFGSADPAGAGANPFAGGASDDDNPFGAGPATGQNPFGATEESTPTDAESGFGAPSDDQNPFGFGAASTGATFAGVRGVTELNEFRYVEQINLSGDSVIRRRMMTKEEARQFDAEWIEFFRDQAIAGGDPAFDGTTADPDSWARWKLYADQLALWGIYCNEFVLQGVDSEFEFTNIIWPGDNYDPDAEEQEGRPGAPEDLRNETRSLDDQLADFNPVPDTRQGREGGEVLDPKQMDAQSKLLYDVWLQDLRAFEEEQVKYMKGLKGRLDERQQRREAYDLWRENQREVIKEMVAEWNRQYEGKVTMIEGVRYELYQPGDEPRSVTRGANVVVTDFDLTPYDILNDNGTLRGPSEQ